MVQGCCEELRITCGMKKKIIDNFAAILHEAKFHNLLFSFVRLVTNLSWSLSFFKLLFFLWYAADAIIIFIALITADAAVIGDQPEIVFDAT
ncbi:unnamed protein product [Cylicostephanus goldi]|uniref:Uncharacterized protein n=1 Tax=Cylicostephanus goldi TaxID=71465 RepID=A0A3P7LSM7_CYLGO|nr:unnamed protein product [Cylicostephanus goldi]